MPWEARLASAHQLFCPRQLWSLNMRSSSERSFPGPDATKRIARSSGFFRANILSRARIACLEYSQTGAAVLAMQNYGAFWPSFPRRDARTPHFRLH
jgi:hypothetical protein